MSGCGSIFSGRRYLYGTSYNLGPLAEAGKEGARIAAEACAASKGDGYIAIDSVCNVSDGLPGYVPQPCYKVVRTRSADEPTVFQKIGSFFKNLF